jgi:hypothetical protein
MTGFGPVEICARRARDWLGGTADCICSPSAILPCYARCSNSSEPLIPILDLKGIPSVDSAAALSTLLGPNAPNTLPDQLGPQP